MCWRKLLILAALAMPLPARAAEHSCAHGRMERLPQLSNFSEDYTGALFRTESGGSVLIEKLVWGVDSENNIFPAIVRGISVPEGTAVDMDSTEHAVRIVSSVEDFSGGYFGLHDGRAWIESLQFGIDEDGELYVAELRGQRPGLGLAAIGGQPGYDALLQTPSCTANPVLTCTDGSCQNSDDCTAPVTNCQCDDGVQGHRCQSGSEIVCPSAAPCQEEGDVCQVDSMGGCDCF